MPCRPWLLLAVFAASFGTTAARAGNTMGLFLNLPGSFTGYTMFEALTYPNTYLIDNEGLLVHSWENNIYVPGNMHYLQENGDLLRCADPGGNDVFIAGGDAGLVQRFDWDGILLWEFLYSDSTVRHHHDIAPLPNGNVLVLAWEYRSGAQAIAAGRDPALLDDGELWPEHIVEVEPVGADSGNIIWEWHLWDHLIQDFDSTKANWGVVGDHPELVDINAVRDGRADWIHANAMDYNADLDQIVISTPFLSEFWIIDHGTTTEEAAGHTGDARGMGGDILYRWGNPERYDRGVAGDRTLFGQHDVHWIAEGLSGAGNILVFNNGVGRPAGQYSTIDEIVTTADANGDYPIPGTGVSHAPAAPVWSYVRTPPEDLWSSFISSAQRQPNGNTLICEGATGNFIEIDGAEQDVWFYISPVNPAGPMTQGDPPTGNTVFRIRRYAPDFPGFDGPGRADRARPRDVRRADRPAAPVRARAELPEPVSPRHDDRVLVDRESSGSPRGLRRARSARGDSGRPPAGRGRAPDPVVRRRTAKRCVFLLAAGRLRDGDA
jgi:hypothetical protein